MLKYVPPRISREVPKQYDREQVLNIKSLDCPEVSITQEKMWKQWGSCTNKIAENLSYELKSLGIVAKFSIKYRSNLPEWTSLYSSWNITENPYTFMIALWQFRDSAITTFDRHWFPEFF